MKKFVKRVSLFSIVSFLSFILLTSATGAQDVTDAVDATVSVQNIALTVTDGSVTYGAIGTSSRKNTTTEATYGVDDSQTITNTGNVDEDFEIKGIATASWAISDTAIDTDVYMHKWCTSDCDGTATWEPFDADYEFIVQDIPAEGADTQVFDLQVHSPSGTSHYETQEPDVTIRATAST